ncbi:hypothetical protein B0H19DRAFT_1300082 [Mycena capillaripes]|nr:hypothetical protein B0H19DRAFT_1300082 [Mycena capillaripes]
MPHTRVKRRTQPQTGIQCPYPGCPKRVKTHRGLTYHVKSEHENKNSVPRAVASQSNSGLGTSPPPLSPHSQEEDPYLDHDPGTLPPPPPPKQPPPSPKTCHPFLSGRPCNENEEFLPAGTPPPPRTTAAPDDWSPYEDSVQFNVADFLYRKVQMSSTNIDYLLEQWAFSLAKHDDLGPFQSYQHLYETIDSTKLGDAPWQCFQTEPLAVGEDAPAWARQSYEVWYRDPEQVMLAGIVQNWCAKCTALPTDLDGNIAGRRTQELTDEILSAFDGDILWDEYGIDEDIIPFTRDFPRADIHEMLSSDLLHQVIKGSFKDHLVTWVGEYLYLVHTKAEADGIMDEIDRRIAAVPAFPCLRRFKQGRRFKQWTGDDSKALMKVYLPAIKGLVPHRVVEALSAFLDFCYLVRRADFDEDTLDAIDASVEKYHGRREVFRELGVRSNGFSLSRQHSITHYRPTIENFGAPGGVCSSITESRHITAVKKPWRRSSRYEALSQMLLTNQRLDKLAAARADFVERGMVPPNFVPVPDKVVDDEDAEETDEARVEGNVVLARRRERSYPRFAADLATFIKVPNFPELLSSFLDDQLASDIYPDNDYSSDGGLDLSQYSISVYHSAVATFYAPSDPSGIRGMRRERIRSTPKWRKHGPRRDCAFAVENQNEQGFRGMSVVRVRLFFSFIYDGVDYPCALVDWFKKVGRSPDLETGMWIVEPEMKGRARLTTIVHLDTLLRGAHLIPVYGEDYLPVGFHYTYSLDAFKSFHVNKYIDRHSNEIAF